MFVGIFQCLDGHIYRALIIRHRQAQLRQTAGHKIVEIGILLGVGSAVELLPVMLGYLLLGNHIVTCTTHKVGPLGGVIASILETVDKYHQTVEILGTKTRVN